jgi:hypothetical protein
MGIAVFAGAETGVEVFEAASLAGLAAVCEPTVGADTGLL